MTIALFVKNIINESFEFLDPYSNFKDILSFDQSILVIDETEIPLSTKVHIFGLGKASSYQILSLKKIFSETNVPVNLGAVISYTKDRHTTGCEGMLELEGSHPVVSEKNIINTKEFIDHLRQVPDEDTLIFLLSGGGSSLLELPIEGLSFEELEKKSEELLLNGASINDMNKVRKSLSQVKDGGLLNFFSNRNIFQFVTCDIPNEHLQDISSGPLMKDGTEGELPKTFVLMSASKLLEKICSGNERRIKGKIYDCDIDTAIDDMLNCLPCSGQQHFTGGEIPILVGSSSGKGGRNTHFVLKFASELYKNEENRDIKILSVGTDGGDGPTDAAGAYIDYDLFLKLDCSKYLEDFNSYEYFEKIGTLIKTGPTKTNVMDLRCVWRD